MVIQEPSPLPAPVKEATPSDGGDLNTPKSKGSSTKAARSGRRRGRSDTERPHNIFRTLYLFCLFDLISSLKCDVTDGNTLVLVFFRLSPSDGDSLGSDQSSGRESAEESTRPVATPSEGKQHRKTPKNGQRHGDIIRMM